jgi:hypothetical protein
MFDPNLHAAHAACWIDIHEQGKKDEQVSEVEGSGDSPDQA